MKGKNVMLGKIDIKRQIINDISLKKHQISPYKKESEHEWQSVSLLFLKNENELIHEQSKEYPTFVYIIKVIGTSFYKIGISINPKKRLYSLQTANPHKLILVKKYKFQSKFEAISVEKEIHTYLKKHKCLGGKEWFCDEKNIIHRAKRLIEKRIRKCRR